MNMRLIANVLGLTVLGAGLVFGDTIGNPVIERVDHDTCVGCSFALATPFAPASGTLSTWSFFADTTGRSITPILYTLTGGQFDIVGIGTTRTVTTLGVNTDPFGLVTGTDAVTGSNFYFGYRDGGAIFGTGNEGTVSLSYTSTGTLMYYFGNGSPDGPENVGISVGQTMLGGGLLQRNYSISATTVPEPMTASVAVFGLLALGFLGRRFSRR